MDKNTTFVVTEQPPWYLTSKSKDFFSCKSTEGHFEEVVNLMMSGKHQLVDREKQFKPKTICRTIKDVLIKDIGAIQQRPSKSLLLALMDLVDIEGGNEFESVINRDKAGIKSVLLAGGNYTMLYIPQKELA